MLASVPAWAIWIGWLLVIVGWVVAHFTAQRRDAQTSRRKGIHEQIDGIRETLEVVRDRAVEYHTSDRDAARERRLVFDLKLVAVRLESLNRLFPGREAPVSACLVGLRRAITRTHFAGEHTAPLESNDDLVYGIDGALFTLLEQLDTIYTDSFGDVPVKY